jgi:hypothetical protein
MQWFNPRVRYALDYTLHLILRHLDKCEHLAATSSQLLSIDVSQVTRPDNAEEMNIKMRTGGIKIVYMTRYVLLPIDGCNSSNSSLACFDVKIPRHCTVDVPSEIS